jgi:hypothetical protein
MTDGRKFYVNNLGMLGGGNIAKISRETTKYLKNNRKQYSR